jgi:hypothetical protein
MLQKTHSLGACLVVFDEVVFEEVVFETVFLGFSTTAAELLPKSALGATETRGALVRPLRARV